MADDTKGFANEVGDLIVTPYVEQNTAKWRGTIGGRTTRHEGYEGSERKWKRWRGPLGIWG
jgi:hypothetical protein